MKSADHGAWKRQSALARGGLRTEGIKFGVRVCQAFSFRCSTEKSTAERLHALCWKISSGASIGVALESASQCDFNHAECKECRAQCTEVGPKGRRKVRARCKLGNVSVMRE
jgi:hypothetical protein